MNMIEVATTQTNLGFYEGLYSVTDFTLYRTPTFWAVHVKYKMCGRNGHVVRAKTTEGRGKTPEEACDVVRTDIMAWAAEDCECLRICTAQEISLRRLCYAADDAMEKTKMMA